MPPSKLRPDGSIDDSFGMNGLTPIELEGEAKALQLHAWMDKILVHVAIGKTIVALARMHRDGSLDASDDMTIPRERSHETSYLRHAPESIRIAGHGFRRGWEGVTATVRL